MSPAKLVRAARRAWWSSMSANSPAMAGRAGINASSRRPNRIASSATSVAQEIAARGAGIALGEYQIDDREHASVRSSSISGSGVR